MATIEPSWSQRIGNVARTAFWILLVAIVLLQVFGARGPENARTDILNRFEQERKSRVIALIHRQESISVLGIPVSSSISIEDSEAVLRAIRLTPPDQPIDLTQVLMKHMSEKAAIALATIFCPRVAGHTISPSP